MKNFMLLTIALILSFNIMLSQSKTIEKAISIKKMYQIDLAGLPRTIELIELTNGEFKGNFKIILDREINSRTEKIEKEISISKTNVKELMKILENMGIESIADCATNNDCAYFLDGDSSYFKITTEKIKREYQFDSLSDEDLKNKKPENRRQAQQILNFIDKRLNLKSEYQEITKKLPSGNYSYFSGNSIYSFEIE